MNIFKRFTFIAATLLALAGCSDSNLNLDTGPYADDSLWLCKPGISGDLCRELDQTLTNVFSDTSLSVVDFVQAENPAFDCFFVYPTVDFNEEPGNTEDLTDVSLILRPLYNEAARFLELCNVYSPLYHQMTISTYDVEGGFRNTPFFERALNDVETAFNQYLTESGDRPFVLIGHSQGSHILIEMLKKRFDNNALMRQRLISAILAGPTGVLRVPEGQVSGGSFQNIPLCTHATDTACVIAWDSMAAGGIADRDIPEEPRPCVNPTNLGGTPGILESFILQASQAPPPPGVETAFFGLPGLHTATCEADGFLGIGRVADDPREFLSPEAIQNVLGGTLHVADMAYTMGDLLRIVEVQAGSMP
jgi:Protein of unknown function (DUF3089)